MAQQSTIGKTATRIRTENGDTIVRYHSTDVVRFNASRIILDSGGWRTATTKTRMNQVANQFGLGIYIHQDKGEWFVGLPHGGRVVPFQDGMSISRD